MKISDLFMPKIVHSDPQVRKKAVLAESDPQTLIKVIQKDADKEVRHAARKRLQRLISKQILMVPRDGYEESAQSVQ